MESNLLNSRCTRILMINKLNTRMCPYISYEFTVKYDGDREPSWMNFTYSKLVNDILIALIVMPANKRRIVFWKRTGNRGFLKVLLTGRNSSEKRKAKSRIQVSKKNMRFCSITRYTWGQNEIFQSRFLSQQIPALVDKY